MGNVVVFIGDLFIWVTSILGGMAILVAVWTAGTSYFKSPKDASLLGTWFTYGYFQNAEGPRFYKEKGLIRRHPLLPWIFLMETWPSDGDGSTSYRGRLTYHAPYIYFTAFEPVYHDRTFEIYVRRMDSGSDAAWLFGLHLGRSYDEGIHTACATVMVRKELDPAASASRPADIAVEEAEFRRVTEPYFAVEPASLQLLMYQSRKP